MKNFKPVIFIIGITLLCSCKNGTKENVKKNIEEKQVTKIPAQKKEIKKLPEQLNPAKVEKKGNVIEFSQPFALSQENIFKGNELELDLSNTTGGMLSAYSLYNDNYKVYFRVLTNDSWTEWEELTEDKEVNNPKRKVFGPKNLDNSVKKIQFKSDSKTEQDVIFRVFTFTKN